MQRLLQYLLGKGKTDTAKLVRAKSLQPLYLRLRTFFVAKVSLRTKLKSLLSHFSVVAKK